MLHYYMLSRWPAAAAAKEVCLGTAHHCVPNQVSPALNTAAASSIRTVALHNTSSTCQSACALCDAATTLVDPSELAAVVDYSKAAAPAPGVRCRMGVLSCHWLSVLTPRVRELAGHRPCTGHAPVSGATGCAKHHRQRPPGDQLHCDRRLAAARSPCSPCLSV